MGIGSLDQESDEDLPVGHGPDRLGLLYFFSVQPVSAGFGRFLYRFLFDHAVVAVMVFADRLGG